MRFEDAVIECFNRKSLWERPQLVEEVRKLVCTTSAGSEAGLKKLFRSTFLNGTKSGVTLGPKGARYREKRGTWLLEVGAHMDKTREEAKMTIRAAAAAMGITVEDYKHLVAGYPIPEKETEKDIANKGLKKQIEKLEAELVRKKETITNLNIALQYARRNTVDAVIGDLFPDDNEIRKKAKDTYYERRKRRAEIKKLCDND